MLGKSGSAEGGQPSAGVWGVPTSSLFSGWEGKRALESPGKRRRKEIMKTGGLSQERLERLRRVMTDYVERGEVPGMITLVSRHGELHVDALGNSSLGGSDPLRRDMIFR